MALKANDGLASCGCSDPDGFIVTPEQWQAWKQPAVVHPYRNGRDLTDHPRNVMVIDLFGLTEEQVRKTYPAIYQHLLQTVKPERDQNNRAVYRDNWWIFGEPRANLRPALAGLPRYIATVETAKHRVFQFLDSSTVPDNKLVVIASSDAYHLGVLSSRIHVAWALASGGFLGVGNDPVYVKSRCFDPFPFPDATEADAIRELSEEELAPQSGPGSEPGSPTDHTRRERLRGGDRATEKEQAPDGEGPGGCRPAPEAGRRRGPGLRLGRGTCSQP